MEEKDFQTLLDLMENAENGGEVEMENLENFLKGKGISIEEAENIRSGKKPAPDTAVEQRRENKGKAGDENRTEKPIDLKTIFSAYNVDMEEDDADGEYDPQDLSGYIEKRGVFSKLPDETSEEYIARNRNAFEKMGLNWNNKEDRARLANSISLAEISNDRANIAEEANGGVGKVGSIFFPRIYEKATNDIKRGTESPLKDYVVAGALDTGENALMTFGSPVSGTVKVVGKVAGKGGKIGKNILKEYQMATSAKGQGLQKLKNLPLVLADNAAVPVIMEGADAVAYDEDDPRGEFSANDAGINTGVNLVAQKMIGRQLGRVASAVPVFGNFVNPENSKIVQAVLPEKLTKNIEKPMGKLAGYEIGIAPLAVNKAGKTEMVRNFPVISNVYEERKGELEKMDKKSNAQIKRETEWAQGFNIPLSSKDRYWKEYQEFMKKNRSRLADYVQED